MNASEHLMEHRWGTRVNLDSPASLRRTYGIESEARIRDVSLSGAFVQTTDRLTRFSRVAVRSLSTPSYWMEAWVVRADDGGVGIEWLEPGSELVLELMVSQRADADRLVAVARS